jgi:hypothetical protein
LGDRYRLKGGRVFNRACVVNIVEHCNLNGPGAGDRVIGCKRTFV